MMDRWACGDIYGTDIAGGFIYAVAEYFPGVVRKIDLATGLAVRDIAVGNDPRGLRCDGAHIWCANYDPAGPGNTVSKIDVATDTVVATVTVGEKPVWIADDLAGSMWVACTGSPNAYVIDIATDAVTIVPLGMTTGCVAFDDRGYMFFGSAASRSLKRVRITTRAVTTLVMPTVVYGLCYGAGCMWATDFGSQLHRIDRMNLSIDTITLPHSPARRPGFDGKRERAWVPCGDSGYTVVVDAKTGAIVRSIDTGAGSNRHVCPDAANAYISAPTGLVKVPLI